MTIERNPNMKPNSTEIIAIASGKGGTGKTIIAGCLGYALMRSGHRVLMVDGDAGTDGLSLFLLGPGGMHQIKNVLPQCTFTGILTSLAGGSKIDVKPYQIRRDVHHEVALDEEDHGVRYDALISAAGIYGDLSDTSESPKSQTDKSDKEYSL